MKTKIEMKSRFTKYFNQYFLTLWWKTIFLSWGGLGSLIIEAKACEIHVNYMWLKSAINGLCIKLRWDWPNLNLSATVKCHFTDFRSTQGLVHNR